MFLEQKQGELLEITRARFRDVITLELLEQKKAALFTRKPRAKFQTLPIFQQRRLLQYILELPTKHISKAYHQINLRQAKKFLLLESMF